MNLIEQIKEEIEKQDANFLFKNGARSMLPLIELLLKQRDDYISSYDSKPWEPTEELNTELIQLLKGGTNG